MKPASNKYGIVPLAEVEREEIEYAMEVLDGDRKTAAKLLGIGRTTLYRKLAAYSADTQKSKSS